MSFAARLPPDRGGPSGRRALGGGIRGASAQNPAAGGGQIVLIAIGALHV